MTKIPLFRAALPAGALEAAAKALATERLSGGDLIVRFENAFGAALGNPRIVATSNASNALTVSLLLAGIGPGDFVVTSPMACLATTMPIALIGARLAWADVNPRTGNIDSARLASFIPERAKALLIPHWGGDPADLASLAAVSRATGLFLIDDASEAQGATQDGRLLGATGSFATIFSFYANKLLSTVDGGALALESDALRDRARCIRDYHIDRMNFRDELGEISPECDIPGRGLGATLSEPASAMGLAGLGHAARRLERHRANGAWLDRALVGIPGLDLIHRPPGTCSAHHVYTCLADRRDDLLRALREREVHASRMHLRNDRYSVFSEAPRADLPGVELFSARAICLPCGWWVSDEDRERIVEAIRRGW